MKRSAVRQACKGLRNYARVFPIGRPQAHLWQGVFEWLAGRPYEARRLWRNSLAADKQLGLPYSEGLTHYEIGRRLPPTDPARTEHLHRAAEIFTHLQATYDLERTQELIQCTTPD